MYCFNTVKYRHQPETCLYSSIHRTAERVKHKFDICWLQTHVKDVTAWGRNHIIDKRSFQGSIRCIFSNVKVQHYDKCMVTIFEYVSLFLSWGSGTLTKNAWYEHTQLVSRFQFERELQFQCLLWKVTQEKTRVNITAESQHSTSCWATPLVCHPKGSSGPVSFLLLPLPLLLYLHRLCSRGCTLPLGQLWQQRTNLLHRTVFLTIHQGQLAHSNHRRLIAGTRDAAGTLE